MEELYREHSRMVYGFLFAKCADADLAEELTQETFYQALRAAYRFRGDSSISTWLCGIANNVWRRHLTKQSKSKGSLSLDDPDTASALHTGGRSHTADPSGASECAGGLQAPSAEQVCIAKLDTLSLMQALHKLEDPMREVLYLRLMGDLSFKEIGQIMEHTENWARVTFYRGKEKIQKGVSIK